jgi:hypothetical protein
MGSEVQRHLSSRLLARVLLRLSLGGCLALLASDAVSRFRAVRFEFYGIGNSIIYVTFNNGLLDVTGVRKYPGPARVKIETCAPSRIQNASCFFFRRWADGPDNDGSWFLLELRHPWLPFLAAVGLLIGTKYASFFRRKVNADGRCELCEYDLTGNVSGTCPECGTGISMGRDT